MRVGTESGGSFAALRTAGVAGILAGFAAASPSDLLAPNNECATAAPVFAGVNPGLSNAGATTSVGVPAACVDINSDVWFSYTATCTGFGTFSTCPAGAGTLVDTVLQVFNGAGGCGALVPLGCNDDACGNHSTVAVPVTSGTLYYVRVGAFGAGTPAFGTFDLTITCTGPPANDQCAGAIPAVTGLNPPAASAGATITVPWTCATGGSDVWYSYVASCTGSTTFTFCSPGATNFDTVLEAFDGSGGCGGLVSLGCDDDTCGLASSVTVPTTAGAAYFVRVGGYAGAAGNFTLLVTTTGGAGSVTLNPTGCGGLTLTSAGSPTLGATVSFTLSGITGPATFIWLGSSTGPGGIPICPPAPCAFGATLTFFFPGPALAVPVPCNPSLVGGAISAQGGAVFGAGGCGPVPFGFPLTLSGTLDLVIG
ncbi:MAG TPA: hypothetical protein VKF62_03490 [Planctomycetota bacterium]|nr:hypothetical protein [Planctomycetota bacterium]